MKPTGRTSLKSVPRVQKNFSRKAYKLGFKIEVLAHWKSSTVEHTLKKFWPEIDGTAALETKR